MNGNILRKGKLHPIYIEGAEGAASHTPIECDGVNSHEAHAAKTRE
jgi:hypothetical protein